ncbi:MAG TPA: hypothetical protein VKZ79_00795 [Alphaproteobacteria bacterium]|nr:hypothetical protein [Alphaproteobacteria bacterium]
MSGLHRLVHARRADMLVITVALLAAADRYFRFPMLSIGGRPPKASHEVGWWTWWDQGKYLDAARAWASGNLDSGQHWYLPGYPLIAAPFVRITPNQPFVIPDLVCLLATLWLLAGLAARLVPGVRGARGLGAVVFLITTIFWSKPLEAWIIPWTTTPATPVILACLLATLRFLDTSRGVDVFLATLAGASVALFRPTDALALLVVVLPFMAWVVFRRVEEPRGRRRYLALAMAGFAPPFLLLAVAHLAIFGNQLGPYLTDSARLGFEWRLVPLRWVTLFVGPRPLFPEGYGLVRMFPWIAPGLGGMAAMLATSKGDGFLRHGLVIAAVIAHCTLYLAYRDLPPPSLWLYYAYHYFKWVLPVFGLYAAFLLITLIASPLRWRAGLIAAAVIVLLFPWRPEWVRDRSSHRVDITDAHAFLLHGGFPAIDSGLLFKARANWEASYLGHHEMRIGDSAFREYADFRVYRVDDGFLLVPLRPLPAGDIAFTTDPGMALDPSFSPVLGRQRIVLGLPCWFRAICPTF